MAEMSEEARRQTLAALGKKFRASPLPEFSGATRQQKLARAREMLLEFQRRNNLPIPPRAKKKKTPKLALKHQHLLATHLRMRQKTTPLLLHLPMTPPLLAVPISPVLVLHVRAAWHHLGTMMPKEVLFPRRKARPRHLPRAGNRFHDPFTVSCPMPHPTSVGRTRHPQMT